MADHLEHDSSGRHDSLMPSLAILFSTLLWGTLWIPLRQLDNAGMSGAWATALGYALPLLLLLPLGLARRHQLAAGGRPLLAAGFIMAVCISLYTEALLRGTVARVMLLFYLTPVWSTLLARFMLYHPLTPRRGVTIVLGLAGMLVVFGVGEGPPLPRSVAEWMGLASGFCWGLSMVYIRRAEGSSDFDKTFVFFVFLGIVFLLLNLIPGGRNWATPTAEILIRSAGWLLALGLLWMPVVIWLTMFGGSRLDPGRVAVLLMLEIVVGLVSAAWLTDEPFGAREVFAAVLIMSASGSEILAGNPEPGAGGSPRMERPPPAR